MSAIVTGAAAPAAPTASPPPARGGLLRAASCTAARPWSAWRLLVLFVLLAAVPRSLFVPWLHGDPRAIGDMPPGETVQRTLLGTTRLGQDIFAQLIYSTRAVAGHRARSRVWSRPSCRSSSASRPRISAGYADDGLSMLTDIFLVLPTFPLIIVLATYAGKGNLTVIIIVLS